MRVSCGVLVGVVALAACGTSSASAGTCGPGAGHTIAHSASARVYSVGDGVFGCAFGSPHTYRLGNTSRSIREGRVGPVAVAGRVAAYGYAEFGVDTLSASVVVRNLGDGAEIRSEPATMRPLGAEFFQSVAAVVVKADGAVAWIGKGGSVISGHAGDVEVDRADARGVALLDSGPGIDPGSLRLRGSTVSWRDRGQTRSGRIM